MGAIENNPYGYGGNGMDEEILAMKIVKKKRMNKDDLRAFRREITILSGVWHDNIINIHDWCETKDQLFIVLDYCGGGNVFDRIAEQRTFTELQASQLIKQVAEALYCLHMQGVVHRDLKVLFYICVVLMFLFKGFGCFIIYTA